MKKYLVNVNGTDYEITLEEVKDGADFPKKAPQAAAPAPAAAAAPAGAENVTAPLPGTITKVLVSEGDKVTKGDTLLTMEAMKLENNIDAPKAGRVTGIRVKDRDAVMEGDLLLTIE